MPLVFDSVISGNRASGVGPLNLSHVLGGGPNRIVVVFVAARDAEGVQTDATPVSVSYNGSLMTAGASYWISPIRISTYYMLASALPAAGTYTVAVTMKTNTNSVLAWAVSLTGAKQAAPEASGTDWGSFPVSGTANPTVTTVSSDAWIFGCCAGTVSAITSGDTSRGTQTNVHYGVVGSSGPKNSPGSKAMTFYGGEAEDYRALVLSIAEQHENGVALGAAF